MKKLSILMAVLFATVTLVACGGNDTVPEAGVWNEDIYVNESLGLQFQLPRRWESLEGDELVEVLGAGAELLAEMDNNFTNEQIEEAMEESAVHDMYAINTFTGSTVQVMVQRMPRSAHRHSSEDFLELLIEEMEEEMGTLNVVSVSDTTQIGSHEFHSEDIDFEVMPGMEMYMQMYVNLDGRNASVIMLGSVTGDEFEDLLDFFNEPGADRIEIEEPESVEESDLIGTWAWPLDEDYLLVFNDDGTGVRGFVVDSMDDIMDELVEELGQAFVDDLLTEFSEAELLELMLYDLVEEFEWEIFMDILYIDLPSVGNFGIANEEWDVVIEGDVLDIASRQSTDLRFSYTKQ